MYIGFIKDRKTMGYACIVDCNCGIYLGDLSHRVVKKVKIAGLIVLFGFGDMKSCEAMGSSRAALPVNMVMSRQESRTRTHSQIGVIVSKEDEMRVMEQLNSLVFRVNSGLITMEEAVLELRGGAFIDVAEGLAIIAAIILLTNNAGGFQYNPHANDLPHLQWLYGNNYKPGQFVKMLMNYSLN